MAIVVFKRFSRSSGEDFCCVLSRIDVDEFISRLGKNKMVVHLLVATVKLYSREKCREILEWAYIIITNEHCSSKMKRARLLDIRV